MKKMIYLLLASIALSACSLDEESNISTITEPDSGSLREPQEGDVGYGTVVGVDSNGINGRDDVEIEIAKEFKGQDEKIVKLNTISSLHLNAVKAMEENNVVEFKKYAVDYMMHKRCYTLSYASTGAEDISKLKSFLYDDARNSISGFISYNDGTYSSLSDTLDYCNSKGFDLSF